MTSKEALKLLYSDAENYAYFNETEEDLSEIIAEYELIKQDLEKLEKLEKEYKEARKSIKSWNVNGGELLRENAKLKKVIEFIKENFEVELHYDEEYDEYTICFMEYDECLEEIAITGITKYVNKEEYDLLKEYL